MTGAEVVAAIGTVWDIRCDVQRNPRMCETCAAFTDLCDELGITPPPPAPEGERP